MAYSDKTGTAVPKFIVHGGFLGGFQLDASNVFSGLPTGSAALADGASAVTGTLNSTAFNGSQKTVISALNQLAYDDTQLQTGITAANNTSTTIGGGTLTLAPGAGMGAIGSYTTNGTVASLSIGVNEVLEDLNTLGVSSANGEFIVATGVGAFAYESGATARTSLGLGGLATLDILDEDGMDTDSATRPPSQQSVKAYVDAQVDTADSLTEMSDVTLTTPGDAALLLYDTGTSTWRDAALSGDATISDTGVITLAANSVDSAELTAGSVDFAHMSVNSIDSDQYVDGSIDLVHMSANSVDSDQYVDGSIDTAHFAAGAVDAAAMGANSVDSSELVNGSVDLAHMSANSVDSDQYVDGSIDSAHIAAGTIANDRLANDGITIAGTDTSLGGSITAAALAGEIAGEAYTQSGILTFAHEKLKMTDSAGTAYTLSIVGGILKIVS